MDQTTPHHSDSALPTQRQDALVRVEEVSLTLDGKDILDAISFETNESRVGIVGRNGSGKTTLARVIAGLIKPTKGAVEVGGVNVAADRKRAIRSVGILFQNPNHQIIFPTVEEEIAFGLIQLGQTKSEAAHGVAEILRRFDKAHWAQAAVHLLSHGQKQLVCLMAILVMQPKVIVLDEPFSGLDIPTRAQMARYLGKVGASLLHISHDPTSLLGYDRVIWMEQGRIQMEGAATPVLAAFAKRMGELGEVDDITDLTR